MLVAFFAPSSSTPQVESGIISGTRAFIGGAVPFVFGQIIRHHAAEEEGRGLKIGSFRENPIGTEDKMAGHEIGPALKHIRSICAVCAAVSPPEKGMPTLFNADGGLETPLSREVHAVININNSRRAIRCGSPAFFGGTVARIGNVVARRIGEAAGGQNAIIIDVNTPGVPLVGDAIGEEGCVSAGVKGYGGVQFRLPGFRVAYGGRSCRWRQVGHNSLRWIFWGCAARSFGRPHKPAHK